MVSASKKDLSVETMRGFAIILVVLGHVIGSDTPGGMEVKDDSFLRYLYYTFEYLRMPLFTVMSCWVYALRPARADNLKSSTIKRVRRILLPMIFVGATYYILQYIIPGTNAKNELSQLWKILAFPYTLYWYLPSQFLGFLFCSVLDSFKAMNTWQGWLVVLGIGIGLLVVRNVFIPESLPNCFSFKGGIYLLPFFIIGIGIQRFPNIFRHKYFSISLVISLAIQQMGWFGVIDYELSKRSDIGLLIGIAGTILFFRLKWKVNWLIWFGSYANTIFLFHSFGTSGGRILIKSAGVYNSFLVFTISLCLGLLLPILVEIILDRFSLTRMLFLGRNYKH